MSHTPQATRHEFPNGIVTIGTDDAFRVIRPSHLPREQKDEIRHRMTVFFNTLVASTLAQGVTE